MQRSGKKSPFFKSGFRPKAKLQPIVQPPEKESTSTKREADAETEEQQALRLHEEKLDVSKEKVEKAK
ncbi:hypothetical protein [Sinobaca sp. H24]|uniref:hypothetical protein n=1 Tax=Sinobaca sp. H24 TaxID=2923376 RepID=UPI0020792BC9|nr:hypothetical protein [Sinobaca sp. H24]